MAIFHKTYEVKNNTRTGWIGHTIAAWGLLAVVISGLLIGFHVLPSDTPVMTISILVLALGWGLRWREL